MYNGLVEDANINKGRLYVVDIYPVLPNIKLRIMALLNMLDLYLNVNVFTENILKSYLSYIGMIISPISNFINVLNEFDFYSRMFIDSDISKSLEVHKDAINSIGRDIGLYINDVILNDNIINDSVYFIFKDVRNNGSLFFYIPSAGEIYD